MILSKMKKNNVYPCKPQFYFIKVEFKGVNIIEVCFRDVVPNSSQYIYIESGHSLFCKIACASGESQISLSTQSQFYEEHLPTV